MFVCLFVTFGLNGFSCTRSMSYIVAVQAPIFIQFSALRTGICRRNYVCRPSSAFCMSSVTFLRPMQPVENIQQCFHPILYPSHLMTSIQNFTDIFPAKLNLRGVAKYSDFGHVEGYISETVQDGASETIDD